MTVNRKKLQKVWTHENSNLRPFAQQMRMLPIDWHSCFNSAIYGAPRPGLKIKCDVSPARTKNNFFGCA